MKQLPLLRLSAVLGYLALFTVTVGPLVLVAHTERHKTDGWKAAKKFLDKNRIISQQLFCSEKPDLNGNYFCGTILDDGVLISLKCSKKEGDKEPKCNEMSEVR